MLFNLQWVKKIFPNCLQYNKLDDQILAVNTNSKKEIKQSLFIPLVGDKFDGHEFVEEAIENGAIAILWQEDKDLPESLCKNISVFLVKDTLKALQTLAEKYREKIGPTVIGITGSNGKTSTKDILASILQTTYRTHYTKGNLNNHIGLPLTILSMSPQTEILIVEMGTNQFGEIKLLSKIAKPNYAIITNIGESHIENLLSREGIAKEKLDIISHLTLNGSLIIDGDEKLLKKKDFDTIQVKTCGFSKGLDYYIEKVKVNQSGTSFILNDQSYDIPLYGKHHAKNSSYAICLAEKLQIPKKHIVQGLKNIKVTDMRFQWIKGKEDVQIINDAYNASPTSMKAAIEIVTQLSTYKRKILVLGDIFELGPHAKMMHKNIANFINPPIDHVFTIGNYAKEITLEIQRHETSITAHHFTNENDLIKALKQYLDKETIILFKASRGMYLENIIEEIC